MAKLKINAGDKFGLLTVIKEVDKIHCKRAFHCECSCGNKGVYKLMLLRSGKTKSCGCLRRKVSAIKATKHGKSTSRLHKIWRGMKDRCLNPNSSTYHHYGGRGITVCDEWMEFEAFLEWAINNGYNKSKSIERINVNGNYIPFNCEWIDPKFQSRNRRDSIYVDHEGMSIPLVEKSELMKVSYSTLYSHVKSGLLKQVKRPICN